MRKGAQVRPLTSIRRCQNHGRGTLEATAAFRAGADYVTVLGVADEATLQAVVQAAEVWGKRTVVDMLCVEDIEKSIPALEALGVDMIAVHVGGSATFGTHALAGLDQN